MSDRSWTDYTTAIGGLEFVLPPARARSLAIDELRFDELPAKKGRELHNFFEERVGQIKSGEAIVRQWRDQEWVARVKETLTADPDRKTREDRYSREIEDKFRALEALVSRFI